MQTLIDVNRLSKSFDTIRAVDHISFTVNRGEVLGFLGPNGAGKSTTMRMISGFLSPSGGSAKIAGFDIIEEPVAAKTNLGYLPEGTPLYGDMTIRTFIEFVAAARGLSGSAAKQGIDRVIERLALQDYLDRRIDTLSKGFKRRVGIAQAIVHDPAVLILDEPTDGLDPNQKHEMRDLINQMASDKAIIISTHLLEEVDAICSRAIVIDRGKIKIDATPQALRQRSAYHNAVIVSVSSAEAATLESKLPSKSVASISKKPLAKGVVELHILPVKGKSILKDVQAVLAESGIVPQTTAVEHGRLDEVFRTLTTETDEDGIDIGEEDRL